MSRVLKVLQPQYLKKFQCICGDCEEVCCNGWTVAIDQKTYELYENFPDPNIRQELQKCFIRNEKAADTNSYAKLKMREDNGNCPFLNTEKMCSIQRDYGKKYLSPICTMYPRVYNIANNLLEKSLIVSCPEAARAVLLNPKLMEFEMAAEAESIPKLFSCYLFVEKEELNTKAEAYFPQIRPFVISLLQTREYQLWQRLFILGLFAKQIDKLVAANKLSEILPLIITYLEQIQTGTVKNSFEYIPNKLDLQLKIIQLIIERKGQTTVNQRFKECFNNALTGLNYSPELPPAELSAHYDFVYQTYYQPFMQDHEYILENYLVNYIFNTLFPFTSDRGVFENYLTLIVHYAMVKMLCIGMAGFYKEDFNADHVIKVIQSLTKVITHDSSFISSLVSFLAENKLDNMAHMAVLIKN
ncbi:MAG: flagellin lysine-N-methylase [Sporomusaceae bacterium]|nr:flagellin lysine-N-methylase [Sporomusaceae bacterium]